MYNRELAKDIFLRYAEQYDMQNILIRHKVEHTLRVAELSGRYAKELGMPVADEDFAWLLGLLHDIGRFEQARRYGTFVDSQSVDHAELSADILFRDGLMERFPDEGLPEDWRMIAETAIRLHNKLTLPETLNSRTRKFAEILRDADKTDIFRVIAGIPFEDRVGSSRASFTEAEEASPEVMACVLEHRCVPSGIRHTRFEGHISHCCMAFELVFDVSRRTVREEGWLGALLAETDAEGKQIWTDRETKQLRILRHEIEKSLGAELSARSAGRSEAEAQ
jgi:putative nucleotidyltransferase with HDIG domain